MPRKPKTLSSEGGAKAKVRKTKPTYKAMIYKAIVKTGVPRKGATDSGIYKYIQANYPVPENFKTRVRLALKSGIDDKELVHPKNNKRRFLLGAKVKNAKKVKKEPSKKKAKKTKSTKKGSKKEKKGNNEKKKAKKSGDKEKPKKKVAKKKSDDKEKPEKKKAAKKKTKKSDEKEAKPKRGRPAKSKAGKKPATRGKKRAREDSDDSDDEITNLKPKPKGRGKAASTRSSSGKSSGSDELTWVWQFLENDGLYYNYDPPACNVVETEYQNYVKSPGATDVRSVKSGQWNYMVDFREMTQQNVQHESHTKRRIRRIQVPASEQSDTNKPYS